MLVRHLRIVLRPQEEDNFDSQRLDDVYERLSQIDADTAEARASAVLAGMLYRHGHIVVEAGAYSRPVLSVLISTRYCRPFILSCGGTIGPETHNHTSRHADFLK